MSTMMISSRGNDFEKVIFLENVIDQTFPRQKRESKGFEIEIEISITNIYLRGVRGSNHLLVNKTDYRVT